MTVCVQVCTNKCAIHELIIENTMANRRATPLLGKGGQILTYQSYFQ